MATAPEVTTNAVKTAERFDCVVEADNNAEWMYILFEEGTPDQEREYVYDSLNDRLDPNPSARRRSDYTEMGLSIPSSVIDPETDERFVELYLVPKYA